MEETTPESKPETKQVEIPSNTHIQSIVHECDGHNVKDPEA